MCPSQRLLCTAVSPGGRSHRSESWGVEGAALLHVNPSDPFGESLFPILTTLGCVGLESLVSKGGTLPQGDTAIVLLSFKL